MAANVTPKQGVQDVEPDIEPASASASASACESATTPTVNEAAVQREVQLAAEAVQTAIEGRQKRLLSTLGNAWRIDDRPSYYLQCVMCNDQK